ncbi:hypothetical protein Ari01nite_94580 [Paractinoplanes rishiriensis]|uniref:Uncharacterized protein n=1 Tax=Paractinoplanes rishiriensis TaxID=1050105 RepID=A0A919MZU9_9ACTN|nr:hypothetical protein Ari01nite_94580 [Actinoplanes rishiriensis]
MLSSLSTCRIGRFRLVSAESVGCAVDIRYSWDFRDRPAADAAPLLVAAATIVTGPERDIGFVQRNGVAGIGAKES